jgi:DNA polymerase III delta subunit
LPIPVEAAQVLADLIGNDLGRLDNEIAKLALQTEGRVDVASITKNVSFQREQEMWDMTDEVAAGNTAAAVKRWRQLTQLDSSAEFRAVTWLTMWLEKVRRSFALKRKGLNDFAIAKELKIWPAEKAKPFLQNAQTLGEGGAGRLVELLAEIDRRSKSGLGEMAENVERFLMATSPRMRN